MSTLTARTVRNISYIAVSQVVTLTLNLGTLAILTRILSPEDFGIVGISLVFISLFMSILDFGLMQAVIQRDTLVDRSIGAALTIRWSIALVLAIGVVLFAPVISAFYGHPDIAKVLIVLAANLFVANLAFAPQIILTRNLRFAELAWASICQYVVFAAVAIASGLVGFSYWSLVYGTLSGSVAYAIALRYCDRTVIKPRFDRALGRELMEFGQHLLVTSLMAFVIFSADQMVMAKVLGLGILGFYVIAVRFGRALGEQISNAVNRVLFPTMARIKDNNERMMTGYLQSLRMISIIAVPLTMGMSALASMFTTQVLGSVWAPASIPLAILAFQGLLNALIPPSSNVLVSIGQPKYMSIQATAQAILMVVFIYPVTVLFGVNGVCALTTLLSFGVLVYFLSVFSRVFRKSFIEMAQPLVRPVLSGGAMFIVVSIAAISVPTSIAALFGLVVLGVVVYVLCLHILSRGRDLADLMRLLKGLIRSDDGLRLT